MNRLLAFAALLLAPLFAWGASPSLESFDQQTFRTNNLPPGIIRVRLNVGQMSTTGTNGITITNVTGVPGSTNLVVFQGTNTMFEFDPTQFGVATNIAGGVTNLFVTVKNNPYMTNIWDYQTLAIYGNFMTPATLSTNLVVGTNNLNVFNQGFIFITGATTNFADSQIRLNTGNGQGSHLWIENYSTNSAFTLQNGSELWDDPTSHVILNGSWIPSQQGEALYLIQDGRGWREVGRLSYIGGFGVAINPTDNRVPYRINPYSFGDSPWQYLAASTNQMGFNSSTPFIYSKPGSGITAVGQNAGTNAGSLSTFLGYNAGKDQTNSGNTMIGYSAAGNQVGSGQLSVGIGRQALNNWNTGDYNVAVGSSSLAATASSDNNVAVGNQTMSGSGGTKSRNVAIGSGAGINAQAVADNVYVGYQAGFNQTVGRNNVLVGSGILEAGQQLTNAIAIGYGITATNNQIVIGNITNTKAVFPIASYTGTGSNFLSDDGTFKAAGIGGGTTINPTDLTLPYRVNATTFGDSYFILPNPNQTFLSNSTLSVSSLAGASTFLSNDHASTINNRQNQIQLADPYNTYGFSAYDLAASSAANPEQSSPSIDWIGQGWNTNAAANREVGFASQVIVHATNDEPWGTWQLMSHINGTKLTNAVVSSASGYTGAGTKALFDDGTYHTVTGGGDTLWYAYTSSPDMEGGTVYSTSNTNAVSTNAVDFAVNDLNSFWGEQSLVGFWGLGHPSASSVALSNTVIYGIGAHPFGNATIQMSANVIGLGDNPFRNATITNAFDIRGWGNQPFFGAHIDGPFNVYMDGDRMCNNTIFANSGADMFATGLQDFNACWITNFVSAIYGLGGQFFVNGTLDGVQDMSILGSSVFPNSHFTNVSDVVAIGNSIPAHTLSGKSHFVIFGSGGVVTNSNDWVAGDSAYNYKFPGASFHSASVISGDIGFASTASDAAVSGTSAGWTNTFGKAAVIRFDGTTLTYNVFNNSLTSIYTNTISVGHGETIIQTGGKILFTSGSVSQWVAAPF